MKTTSMNECWSIRVLEKLGMKQVNRALEDGRWLLYYEARIGWHLLFADGVNEIFGS